MKKIVFLSFICFLCIFPISAQSSISINYIYVGGKKKYAETGVVGIDLGVSKDLANNGIGIQGKFIKKNRFYIIPDFGYFFEEYEKITKTINPLYYQESKLQCFTANVNFAYDILQDEHIKILLFAGAGFFHEYAWIHVYREGNHENPPLTIYTFDITNRQRHFSSIACNMGFNLELYMSKKIFVNAGLKFMLDVLPPFPVHIGFPYINIGVGYSL